MAEGNGRTGTMRVKSGLAQMLKGGVIMDVTTPEQARIAEEAGACAVMALERIPADIRADGGVARMSDPEMIAGIQEAVSIPVMAKCRIGHFVEAQVLRGARDRLHRRVRGADAGRREPPHRQARLHGALRVRGHRPRRGAAADLRGRGDDPHQGRGGDGQRRRGRAPHARDPGRHRARSPGRPPEELHAAAKDLRAPYELVARGRRRRPPAGGATSPRGASPRRPTPR